MSDEKLNRIRETVDSYIDIIENPNYINNFNIVNMKMIFDNRLFIESGLFANRCSRHCFTSNKMDS